MLSRVWLFVTPSTEAHQAPLSMGFSRQEYWRGQWFPSSGNLPNPEIILASLAKSPALQVGSLPLSHRGIPCLALWGAAKLFSAATSPFYILIIWLGGFQFLHTLVNACYFPFVWFFKLAPSWCVCFRFSERGKLLQTYCFENLLWNVEVIFLGI